MSNQEYHPEGYWSTVAKTIKVRGKEGGFIAGDNEPFYKYKRSEFLKMLSKLNLKEKSVLEVGSGPGGNLMFLSETSGANKIAGADISQNMIDIANQNINNSKITIHKTNGSKLPFKNSEFDTIFTATVLQHNTDQDMLMDLVGEICRVASDQVVLFERTEQKIKGDALNIGRPVSYYENICNKNGFRLNHIEYININISYYVCGAIRKVFNSSVRKEGEPLSKFSIFLQRATLPITKILDKIFTSKRELTAMEFIPKN